MRLRLSARIPSLRYSKRGGPCSPWRLLWSRRSTSIPAGRTSWFSTYRYRIQPAASPATRRIDDSGRKRPGDYYQAFCETTAPGFFDRYAAEFAARTHLLDEHGYVLPGA